MRESDPTRESNSDHNEHNNQFYPNSSNARNLCFALADGKFVFLNYVDLIRGEYSKESSEISLTFTTDVVRLRGSSLETLFFQLMEHLPKYITSTNERYKSIVMEDECYVSEIVLTPIER